MQKNSKDYRINPVAKPGFARDCSSNQPYRDYSSNQSIQIQPKVSLLQNRGLVKEEKRLARRKIS